MLVLLLAACSSSETVNEDVDNQLEENETISDDSSEGNNSISDVSYAADIAPIMSQNCTSCHGSAPSNGASAALTNASEVRQAIESFNLTGRIESGNMPKNAARLDPSDVEKVKVWQEEGFKD